MRTVECILVSDATALAVVGLTPRQFRVAVRKRGIPSTRIGKRTVCRLVDFLESVGLAGEPRPAPLDEATVVELAARRRAR